MKTQRKNIPLTITVLIICFFFLVPLFFVLVSSLKPYKEFVHIPFRFFPSSFTYFDNYKFLIKDMDFLAYYKNNIIVTVGIVVPQLIVSMLAAYAFARLEFPMKKFLFFSCLVALMVPLQMILIPRYRLMMDMHLLDKFTGIIIPLVPSITTTFYLRQHIMSIPLSFDESAKLDGASHLCILVHIIAPLSKSALLTCALISIVYSWNTFLWPLVVVNSKSKFVLSMAVANLQGMKFTYQNHIMAAVVIASLPIIILFFIFQRFFIAGIVSSGIKE